ncbi:hypothetical protein H072_8261 [Dactylellina haptotyla CBS 200.50]|uniref:Uncharacterized protein n=1 Tax=Dactylellina haptotyla (strain CBS 200.50) TaxID=1284197 RepID=S8A5E8_DACHA|nr:hypothetical protein H072_8261 [Dactylellina haptotyla CBS 200.50]
MRVFCLFYLVLGFSAFVEAVPIFHSEISKTALKIRKRDDLSDLLARLFGIPVEPPSQNDGPHIMRMSSGALAVPEGSATITKRAPLDLNNVPPVDAPVDINLPTHWRLLPLSKEDLTRSVDTGKRAIPPALLHLSPVSPPKLPDGDGSTELIRLNPGDENIFKRVFRRFLDQNESEALVPRGDNLSRQAPGVSGFSGIVVLAKTQCKDLVPPSFASSNLAEIAHVCGTDQKEFAIIVKVPVRSPPGSQPSPAPQKRGNKHAQHVAGVIGAEPIASHLTTRENTYGPGDAAIMMEFAQLCIHIKEALTAQGVFGFAASNYSDPIFSTSDWGESLDWYSSLTSPLKMATRIYIWSVAFLSVFVPSHGQVTGTYSEPTATGASPTATGVSINNGKAYLTFETIPGFFLQDDPSTNPSTFDYTATNFGLINRSYPTDDEDSPKKTQWQRFNYYVDQLNHGSGRNIEYRLLFIGRHSEGYHNAEESFVGTPAWNCYWAEIYGNGTAVWEDPSLTPFGISQAVKAHDFWKSQIEVQKITPPDAYYVSPLARCLETANVTYSGLPLKSRHPFIPTVKEWLREGISIHTCDRRSSKSWIAANYPDYVIEPTFSETDAQWNGITSETSSAQAYRMKVVLSDIFDNDHSTIISITTHSGAARSLLSVLGHIPFSLVTGAIIPTLIKITTVREPPSPTTTQPWTTEAWCTNGPPVASVSGICTCSGGVLPVTASPIISPR